VALALVYLFALRVCGFTGGVVKGESRVCRSSTCVLCALRVVAFMGGVMVSLES
jgi:hypothetical protein